MARLARQGATRDNAGMNATSSAPQSDRPATSEYMPYYGRYISLVADGQIVDILERQIAGTLPFLQDLTEEQAALRYAPGKWSIKQVLGHVSDTERVFGFRALAFSRAERKHLPGFEQDDYVKAVDFDARSWRALIDEFAVVRAASIALFRGMTPEMLLRRGVASDAEVSVRACGYSIAGHELYHMRAIQRQYLGQP
jgi:hypothetical protein